MRDPGSDPLLPALAAGDEQAFEALYDRFGERLYRAALAMLARPEDAEDAVQEVFTAMVRSRESLAGVRDLGAYLFASLRRASARCVARRAGAGGVGAGGRGGGPSGPACCGRRPRERLQRSLRRLPAEQREVLALKIDGGLTFAEVARALGIGANTAASRYRYALEKLRAAMEEWT